VIGNKFCLLVLISFAFFSLKNATAQNQLIMMKRGTVIARFNEGDHIKCHLKNNKIAEGLAFRFNDYSIITLNDTILFSTIDKINVKGRRKASPLNKLGTVMMIAGIGYFVIDEVNTLLFVKGQSGIDSNVAITSLSLTAVGAALRYIRSPYQKLRGLSLRTIDPSSRYYRYD